MWRRCGELLLLSSLGCTFMKERVCTHMDAQRRQLFISAASLLHENVSRFLSPLAGSVRVIKPASVRLQGLISLPAGSPRPSYVCVHTHTLFLCVSPSKEQQHKCCFKEKRKKTRWIYVSALFSVAAPHRVLVVCLWFQRTTVAINTVSGLNPASDVRAGPKSEELRRKLSPFVLRRVTWRDLWGDVCRVKEGSR